MSGRSRPDPRTARGRAGEDAAASLYRDRGYTVLARNWRCRAGEIDLIVEREGLLIFCEVKARVGSALGGGYEAVTARKRKKLQQLGDLFLRIERPPHDRVRFDVASVQLSSAGTSVELFEDAF